MAAPVHVLTTVERFCLSCRNENGKLSESKKKIGKSIENNFKMNVKGNNCAEKPVEEGK